MTAVLADTEAAPAPERAKLRRALRTAIDVVAIAPSILAALKDETGEAQRRVATVLADVHEHLAPVRSRLAAIDADEQTCVDVLLGLVQKHADLPARLVDVERLWELAGIASRLVYTERLAQPSERSAPPPRALSPMERAANRRLVILEAFAGRSHITGKPWRHLIDVSSVCNLRCKTCYQANSQDFIYYDYAAAQNDAVASAMPYADYINIGGTGEPLLSSTAPDLIKSYARLGAHVELTTNGTLPERLAAVAPHASSINISMDGASKETFDVIRFGANFDKVTAAIRDLPDSQRRKININCVVTRPNAHEGGDFIRLGQSLGVGGVTFQEFFAYLPWHGDMALRPQDRRVFFDSLNTADPKAEPALNVSIHVARSEQAATNEGRTGEETLAALRSVPPPKPKRMKWDELATTLEATSPQAIAILRDAVELAAPSKLENHRASKAAELVAEIGARIEAGTATSPGCLAPFNLLYLQGDGEMRPCCILRTQVGSLAKGSFEDAWNDPAFVDFRKTIQGDRPVHSACIGCKDGNRWGDLVAALQTLEAEGLDVTRIARPADFEAPESVATHPLVKAWGSKA